MDDGEKQLVHIQKRIIVCSNLRQKLTRNSVNKKIKLTLIDSLVLPQKGIIM